MRTHKQLIQDWFGTTVPAHYFHNGCGTEWYVFERGDDAGYGKFLIMRCEDGGSLEAIGIEATFGGVHDLFIQVKQYNPDTAWVH